MRSGGGCTVSALQHGSAGERDVSHREFTIVNATATYG
jgi:hypothetical protein